MSEQVAAYGVEKGRFAVTDEASAERRRSQKLA